MPNKSTEAGYHIVTPQGGVNQRDDVASLDEKTFSNLEGVVPRQTGMLERATGKATLVKYADSIWGIAQCWTPAGLIAGYSQYGSSLTYQPWALTWGPIDVSIPIWIEVDPNDYTLPAMSGGGGSSSSSNSSSGASGGTGANRRPHWEWQTFTLTINNNVQYKGDTSTSWIAGTVKSPPGVSSADCPDYLAPLNTQGSNYTLGFYASLAQTSQVFLGSYHSGPQTYDINKAQSVTESHNTFTVSISGENPQIQLRYFNQLINGTITNQSDNWVAITSGNYDSSAWIPPCPTQVVTNTSSHYEIYRASTVTVTPATSGTYRALVKKYS